MSEEQMRNEKLYYIQDHHTPIVDRETFNMVQTVRSLRSRKGHPVQYPYGGRITCPICGQKMERLVLERTGSPAAWHCPPEHGNPECAGYYVAEEYIDAALRQAYAELDTEVLAKQANKRDEKIAQAAQEVLRMKQEKPELAEIHYFFLDKMVEDITFKKWDTMVITWKCGLKSRIHINYKRACDFPNSKEQLGTLVSKRWVKKAEEAAKAGEKADAKGANTLPGQADE